MGSAIGKSEAIGCCKPPLRTCQRVQQQPGCHHGTDPITDKTNAHKCRGTLTRLCKLNVLGNLVSENKVYSWVMRMIQLSHSCSCLCCITRSVTWIISWCRTIGCVMSEDFLTAYQMLTETVEELADEIE